MNSGTRNMMKIIMSNVMLTLYTIYILVEFYKYCEQRRPWTLEQKYDEKFS